MSSASSADVRTLVDATKQITKALESGDPPATLLALLQPLESVKVSEDALRKSKIGIAVTRLRTAGKDPKVSELAGKLVARWKAEVSRQKAASAAAGSASPAVKALSSPAANATRPASGSPAPPSSSAAQPTATDVLSSSKKDQPKDRPAAAATSTVDPEKRTTATDSINHKLTGEPARDGGIKLMYDGLAFLSHEPSSTILPVARAIEAAAFSHFSSSVSAAYKSQIRSLFQNLKIRNNTWLRRDVLNGTITPAHFVAMTTEDLKSAEKKAEDAALEKENMNKAMTAKEEKAISTTMQCGKCKAFKVSYSQAQTRSADEPLTTFCECVACGHRWKFS